MIVCIAEKPSVAKDIAKVLGATHMKDGYLEGNNYQVTWTFGHFCTLKEPHDYYPEWKSWRIEYLPILPQNFGIKLIDNQGVKKQFKIIEQLIHAPMCEYIINCGDAGQEGELIQRWVLLKAKNNKPVKRLWISSLTEEAIKEGFENLKESEQYDNLFAAGSARAIGDWLLGINATRAFTTHFSQGKTVLSIGRVQTPTLAMIVQRQLEIDAFKSSIYWELKTRYRDVIFTASIDRLTDEERANKGVNYLLQHELAITHYEIKDGKEKNPRLYDLTSLQVDANKKHAYAAEHTLKLIQNLYEKKHVTYPRVDTTYLPDDMYPKIPGIMQALQGYQEFISPLLEASIPKTKHVFDNAKVTDHHAIIPTHIYPQHLSQEEWHIYDLIVRRFIAAFYPECKLANTIVNAIVGTIPFKVTGKQILDPGWKILYPKEVKEKKDGEDEEQELPIFEIGEKGPHEPYAHKGKTSPPKPYTEATILRAMETAGKQVDDEELRDLIKENGIGRPSTRANIIETLFKRKYIEKKKRNLIATPTGIDLIQCINNDLLKSAELTGTWEKKLREIEKGTYDIGQFKQELFELVHQVIFDVKYKNRNASISVGEPIIESKKEKPKKEKVVIDITQEQCPKCKQQLLLKGKTAYGCADYKQCGFKIPFEIFGKKVTDKMVLDLLQKRKTGKIKGWTIENMHKDGALILNELWELVVQ